jgi:hypothetical protein
MKTISGVAGSYPLAGGGPHGEVKTYRKTGLVTAAPLTEDVVVDTPEGPMKAKKGDYLCQAPDGHAWPVMRAYFEDNNEEVEDASVEVQGS